jgi:hypothetical protein
MADTPLVRFLDKQLVLLKKKTKAFFVCLSELPWGPVSSKDSLFSIITMR